MCSGIILKRRMHKVLRCQGCPARGSSSLQQRAAAAATFQHAPVAHLARAVAMSALTPTQTQPETAAVVSLPTFVAGSIYPEKYQEQLAAKTSKVRSLLSAFKLPEIEVHKSNVSHYRMKAEFQVWHEDQDLFYVMFERPDDAAAAAADADGSNAAEPLAAADLHTQAGSSSAPAVGTDDAGTPVVDQAGAAAMVHATPDAAADAQLQHETDARGKKNKKKRKMSPGKSGSKKRMAPVRIDDFPVASQLICSLMPVLRQELLAGSDVLRKKLFQVNFHTTLSKEAMVTLVYHKQLDDAWQVAAAALRTKLLTALGPQQCSQLHVIGRSRKQKVMLDSNHVTEAMEVQGRSYQYMQMEGCFSQPNGGICQQMLNWAVDVTKGSSGDLLELYCGNGNFTIPLAQNFRQVVATEVSKSSVVAARHNIQANSISNIFLARMSSEEFVETWRVKGQRTRLTGLHWDQVEFSTLLVDPPRAGLDPDTEQLLCEFDQVVYISCNPETLAKNLQAVAHTHDIQRCAVFDQFPYTHHLECGVLLRRRAGA